MNKFLASAKQKYKEENFDQAIEILDQAINNCVLYPEVLIQKAACLQLSKKIDGSLEEIENLYHEALSIDENYYNTLIEIADFYYAVLDKTELAKSYFEKALNIISKNYSETVIGIAKCIEELENEESALEFINTINSNILENEKIKDYIQNLKS